MQHGEEEGLALMPCDAKHWPFIERAVLQATKADEETSSPIWLRHEQQRKTNADMRHGRYIRTESHGSFSSAEGSGHHSKSGSRTGSRQGSRSGSRAGSRHGSRRQSKAEL